MWDIFSSPLSGWQWLLFALVPPAIVALYFLKLRRQPLEVPSTYLWHRTLEDMHVNSLWQRLRKNILLLLQLLLIGLLMLACLRPNWMGTKLVEDRAIILIDNSASMTTTDGEGGIPRLAEAKKQAHRVIDRMKPRDVAMIISFADGVSDVLPFTGDRRLLRRRLDAIEPTERSTDIGEALRAAAGLANPGRSGDVGAGDTPAADPLPAALYIFSDGGYRTVPEFSWGNLQPKYVSIGQTDTPNIGVVAFSAQPIPSKPGKLQALAQVENFTDQEMPVEISLYLGDQLLDAAETTLLPKKTGGADFTFDRPDAGTLRVEVTPNDEFMMDNVAYAVINPPDKAQVLVVTEGSEPLELALTTEEARDVSQLFSLDPAELQSDSYKAQAADGNWDLIVFDNCTPEEHPNANTIYLGKLPPSEEWSTEGQKIAPQIIDLDVSHPMMRYLDLSNVTIYAGTPLTAPTGNRVLIDCDVGPIACVAPRDGFEDVVVGFPLIGSDEDGSLFTNTDWSIRPSFPLFFLNAIQYLAGAEQIENQPIVQPGEPIALRVPDMDEIRIRSPRGNESEVSRAADNSFVYQDTMAIGIYEYEVERKLQDKSKEKQIRRFAVNLFDPTESNITPRGSFDTAWNTVTAQEALESRRHEAWRWFALLALAVLVLEWYVYNRRVFL